MALLTPSVDVRRSGDRFATDIGWLDSKHSFSFGQHYDPRQHPLRAAAGQQRRRRGARHRLRDPPAPGHGDRHLGAARAAGPPGLAGAQRPDLPGPGPADERRHRHPALREERQLAADRRRRAQGPGALRADVGACPTRTASQPGYEQLEIDDELLRGGLVPVASGRPRAQGRGRDLDRPAARRAARRADGAGRRRSRSRTRRSCTCTSPTARSSSRAPARWAPATPRGSPAAPASW